MNETITRLHSNTSVDTIYQVHYTIHSIGNKHSLFRPTNFTEFYYFLSTSHRLFTTANTNLTSTGLFIYVAPPRSPHYIESRGSNTIIVFRKSPCIVSPGNARASRRYRRRKSSPHPSSGRNNIDWNFPGRKT